MSLQPYQQASEETIMQKMRPLQAAGAIASTAGALMGPSLIGRIMPFLSNYIPQNLAEKGLAKVDPRLGQFLEKAQEAGHTFDQVKEFMKEKVGSGMAQESRNIIEQYSPELHNFMLGEIQKGRSPIEAGALAQNDKRFSNIINKLMKDHKTPWSKILQGIYGAGQAAQPMQPQQPAPGQVQQQPNMGQGQQALMQMIQKINSRLG